MKNNNYHLFLFFSTFVRSLVETFSLVFLYKKGFSVDNILLFLFFMYIFGILVNYVSLKINLKVVLIVSSLLYGGSYLFLNYMDSGLISLIVFSLLLSFGSYSYHCMRHYLALCYKVKNISYVVNIMFFGVILSSVVGTLIVSKLNIFVVSIILVVLSILSLIPILKFDINVKSEKNKKVIISKRKILFNILEQFKVVFLELQPLFLYLYISDSVSYVGWFNIVINISSLVLLLFISKRKIFGRFFFISLILGAILLFKISISNRVILVLVAIIEGIFVKMYERGSLINFYDVGSNSIKSYLMVEELIFFGSKSIIMGMFLLMELELKTMMFLCILGIIISGIFIDKDVLYNDK